MIIEQKPASATAEPTSLAAHRAKVEARESCLAALRRWAMREQGARMRQAQTTAWWPVEKAVP